MYPYIGSLAAGASVTIQSPIDSIAILANNTDNGVAVYISPDGSTFYKIAQSGEILQGYTLNDVGNFGPPIILPSGWYLKCTNTTTGSIDYYIVLIEI